MEQNAATPPITIKVERNSRGYNFEVKVAGDNEDELKDRLKRLTQHLNAEYPQG